MSDFLFSRVPNGWIVTLSSDNGTEQAVFADGHSGDCFYDPAESLQRALWAAFGTYMAGNGHAGLDVGVHAAPEPSKGPTPLITPRRLTRKTKKANKGPIVSLVGRKPKTSKPVTLTIVPPESP
jgi:hypothetical protein